MLLACALCVSTISVAVETSPTDQPGPEVSIWVDDASLDMVIQQLAQMSGSEVAIDGELDGKVSGRFSGTMHETLATLSESYPVLFDLSDDTLHVVNKSEQSSVAIAMSTPSLDEAYRASLMEGLVSGNDIEFRDDSVRVSGHPAFVKRTAKSITTAMADAGARAQANPSEDAVAKAESEANPESEADTVVDAGAKVLVDDMQDDVKPASERASLSKPIEWVTDIPGYNTF